MTVVSEQSRSIFGTVEVRDLLLRFVPIAVTDSDVVVDLCDAIGSLATAHPRNQQMFRTAEVRDALVRLAAHIHSAPGAEALCYTINAIIGAANDETSSCALFCTEAIRDGLVNVTPFVTTRACVVKLARLLLRLLSHNDGGVFVTSAVVSMLVNVSQIATDLKNDESKVTADVAVVTVGDVFRCMTTTDAGRALCSTEGVRDALVCLSQHATSSGSVASISASIGNMLSCSPDSVDTPDVILKGVTLTSSHASRSGALFATEAVGSALIRMAEHATSCDSVTQLCCAIANLAACHRGGSHQLVSAPLRDALVRMTKHVTSSDGVEQLSRAVCHLTADEVCRMRKWIGGTVLRSFDAGIVSRVRRVNSRRIVVKRTATGALGSAETSHRVFGTVAVRDALTSVAPHATTSSSVLWLCAAIHNIIQLTPEVTHGT